MMDNNDLWNLDRQDYVALVTELRAELAQARADVSLYHHANQLHIRRRHRSRRTIRALVVAARAMWDVLGFFDTRSMMVDGLRHTIKQSGQQAGE